jgi:teichuronic acid biosynthesis glycosyltransferase TuaG
MMEKPLVSVVMPVHNGEQYLADAIQSVLGQTFVSWELLVSDDGSSDDSVSITRAFCRRDSRISLVTGATRGGPARARNRAIDVARGRWIAFLDCDDVWQPDKLSATLEFAQLNRLALAYTAYTRVSVKGSVLIQVLSTATYRKLLKSNHIATSTVLVDRELVPDLRMNEAFQPDDYIAWLGILKQGLAVGGLQRATTQYRKSRGSHSNNKVKAARRVFRLYRKQQMLSWPETLWYFGNYAVRGALKHSPLATFILRKNVPR